MVMDLRRGGIQYDEEDREMKARWIGFYRVQRFPEMIKARV